jgi:hypothetical protein
MEISDAMQFLLSLDLMITSYYEYEFEIINLMVRHRMPTAQQHRFAMFSWVG